MTSPDDPGLPARFERLVRPVLVWGVLLAAIHQIRVFLSLTLDGRERELWFFFSSDTVQYGLLHKDLFDLGFHFRGWNISHAPEYAQMAVALLARSLTPTFATGHVLEALIQPVLLAITLYALLRRGFGRIASAAPLVVAAALTLVVRGRGLDLFAFFWSNRHGYTAMLALAALAVVLPLRPFSRRRAVTLGVIVALGLASDLLFAVWLIAPLIAAVAFVAWRDSSPEVRSHARTVGAVAVTGGLSGLLAFRLATPIMTVGSKVGLDFERSPGALGRILDDARSGSPSWNLLLLLLGAGLAISLTATLRAKAIETRLLAAYATALPFATLGALVLTATPLRESGYTRYVLGPELAALTTLCLAISRLGNGRGVFLVALAVATPLAAGFSRLPANVDPVERYYPPVVRCIDEAAKKHGLQFGVTDYWLSKLVTALSKNDLSLVAVTPRLDPFIPFSNIEWFLGGVGAKRHDRPEYTFAILGGTLPHETGLAPQAVAALGEPVATESCYGFTVVVLPHGSSERLRAQFALNPRIRDYYARRGLPVPAP